ncbi:MAG: ATP-binding cassette domain-containing protein [Spirochaetales bacterium]|nr:ATP-binding cassette domain-containing protein [Spirochaetales bacterium]
MVAPEFILKNLKKEFRMDGKTITAVNSINMKLAAGKITALVGDSGCGKTTLLRMLAGLLKPDSGEIRIHPDNTGASVVFQDARLLPWRTVEENLLLSLRRTQNPPLSSGEKDRRVNDALTLVHLQQWKGSYPRQLSGGMAQRVSLARALCQKKGFLLMDEPFSALDALTRETLQYELKGIQKKMGNTILFITHDIREAVFLADHVWVMKSGSLNGELKTDEGNPEQQCREIHTMLGLDVKTPA